MSFLVASGWLFAAWLISLLVVRGAISYTQRRGMLDQPGRRRSHVQPTPRGGGVGIVGAILVCVPGVLCTGTAAWPVSLVATVVAALALIALVGWRDDRRSLPVWPRLAAQVLAVGAFAVALLGEYESWWWLLVLLPAGVWSINLHNFMDGIDGLLALQTIFVASGLALLAWSAGQSALALASVVLVLAAFGFWIYNRPPARIFMGDVGSGSVGLMVFVFSAMLWRADAQSLWPALVLSSAFAVDAGLTLLSRILRGRRWYSAHREHGYQWLVRCGATHAQAAAIYLAWDLLVTAPLAWWAASQPSRAMLITIVAYLAASVAWLLLKRRLLRRHPPRVRHAAA
jgi:UDP-N-acetylmuramyl pentapeptide phosphotransferase/UDP-N-acetylglucosamine-1-phosphate transferase